MPFSRQSKLALHLTFLALSLGAMGTECDDPTAAAPTGPTCKAGTAQLGVWDGRIQKVCGCGGVDGEFATPGAALTCTALAGTVVFIYYHGPFLRHQLVPVGVPAIPPSSVFDPKSKFPVRAYAIQTSATGTFLFEDEFDHSIFGNLIVTP